MKQRFDRPVFSKPFYDTILNLNLPGSTYNKERAMDLSRLPPDYKTKLVSADKIFLNVLRPYPNVATRFPKFRGLCELSPDKLTSDRLYNSETCAKFHTILCTMLKVFCEGLTELGAYKAEMGLKSLEERVGYVIRHGIILKAIVYSCTLELHLQHIADLLAVPYTEYLRESKKNHPNIVGEDVTLEMLQTMTIHDCGTVRPIWQSFREWLRLSVVYIEASWRLNLFLSNKPGLEITETLSMQVIGTPH